LDVLTFSLVVSQEQYPTNLLLALDSDLNQSWGPLLRTTNEPWCLHVLPDNPVVVQFLQGSFGCLCLFAWKFSEGWQYSIVNCSTIVQACLICLTVWFWLSFRSVGLFRQVVSCLVLLPHTLSRVLSMKGLCCGMLDFLRQNHWCNLST
jgi:hypothetical protein